ncbi:protein ren [Salmonella enterica]|nr:protein ren [Salmonella enterica]ECH1486192.1 protein ren [Salmonella enterica subsp. enterica serovar Bredeney]ECH9261019.1 protein ren [Salmonella enterica subsp. enterica]ECY5873980.1 protein ren [Salmonella enterica subsp. enterica serovar Telelkebir]EHB3480403.1 protein ren [Salmonella enterica subsp. enterica serovar Newport]HER1264757.1 protein ren [Salmonella enterica subsp. enterica serovar 28:e,h:z6]
MMTGKEAILNYLQNNSSFTTSDVARESGCVRSRVSNAAGVMFRKGELTSVKNGDGTVTYFIRPGQDFVLSTDCSIFEQCRKSAAMKRVLVVWGVLAPETLNER